MQREMRALVLAGMLLGIGNSASRAEDEAGYYRIHAAGTVICNDWVSARAAEGTARRQLEWWVAGYMTAYNRYILTKTRVTPGWDAQDYYAWIDAYCAERPGNRLATAMERLLHRLGVRPAPWLERRSDEAG